MHIAPGAGNTQTFGYELDLNNFSDSCRAYTGRCFSVGLFFNGIGSYPHTAAMYMGGSSVETRHGTAIVTSSQIIWASGPLFSDSVDRVVIAGSIYYVTYADSTHYTIVSGPGTVFGTPVSYEGTNSLYSYGILFQEDTAIGDVDVGLLTASRQAVRIAGKHYIGIDTTGDQTKYALSTAANQKTCFSGLTACLNYDPTNHMLTYQGGRINLHDTGTLDLDSGGAHCALIPGTSALTTACSSDERLKSGIVDAAPALPRLLDFRIRDFIETATGKHQTGTIAQEVRETHPDLVREGKDGLLTVEQPNPWLLVKAVQELRAENDALRLELRVAEALGALGIIFLVLRRRAA
jgi:hypothetical protein